MVFIVTMVARKVVGLARSVFHGDLDAIVSILAGLVILAVVWRLMVRKPCPEVEEENNRRQ
jgi:hypothetical protein